jgi:hypothetical protein
LFQQHLDYFFQLHNFATAKNWLESKRENCSMRNGEFIPWITYPALNFLEQINIRNMHVVEFGSGASTLYFSLKAKTITSFEFDSSYFSSAQDYFAKSSIVYIDASKLITSTDAISSLSKYRPFLHMDFKHRQIESTGLISIDSSTLNRIVKELSKADLVFVDGGPRSFLTCLIAEHVKSALILIDNSDSDYVRFAIPELRQAGFREIPFHGVGPLNKEEWQTSFFLRSLVDLPGVD